MTYVRDDVKNLLGMMAAVEGPQMHEVDAETARQMYLQMGAIAERPAPADVATANFEIPRPANSGPAGAIKARSYRPANAAADGPTICFFHGGGWVIGDLDSHNSLVAEIAKLTGFNAVAVDYRLAPEAPWPAAVDDALAAARWIASSPASLGFKVSRLIFAGDSAGGNLSAISARALRRELPVAAQWLIYPGTDMAADSGSMVEFAEGYLLTAAGMAWFGTHYAPDPAHELASPILSADWADLPPALVFTCGLDPLRDQGRAYAAKLAAAGTRLITREAAGQVHGSAQLRAAIPSAQADLEAQVADLKALLA
ncbi:alpha/beta hydrolase [Sandaracinobacter neustonicus]|uniref:alpha/beta hydrolase n=1 Tax=Sandaracinobacter neustonicus TaxID=1715348 RepID=UPI001A9C9C4B|nr:alpha/beta hydrolase [Sandaracinobacter neustonicus]